MISSQRRSLSQHLLPLAIALAFVIGLILTLTWGALQIQVTLAGFLNGESVWSKAQKQAVIDLEVYARTGRAETLADYRKNMAVLASDRWARDAIASGHFDHARVRQAFRDAHVIPEAIDGMIFMLHYFSSAPYMSKALAAWYSTDATVDGLDRIAEELQQAHADGSMTPAMASAARERIAEANRFIEPRSNLFSSQIADGAAWIGTMLFLTVLVAALAASLLWLRMARRILHGIRGSEERYRLLFDSANDAIVMVDEARGHILEANHTARDWIGCTRGQLEGRSFDAIFVGGSQPQARRGAVGMLLTDDGRQHPVEIESSLVTWGGRQVRQAIMRDVSERVTMERERRVAAEALAGIAEGVIIADAERRVVSVNTAHVEITGFDAQALLGRRFDEMRRMPDGEPLPESIWISLAGGRHWNGEVQSRRRDGSVYPEQLSISAIRDAQHRVLHYVAVFSNMQAAKAQRQRLEYMATHDPLTGLANRVAFERHCSAAIAAASRARTAVAVLFIDLDAFKIINDSYSHALGDRVLQKIAERIGRQLSGNDMAGRIGGDEFTVLLDRLELREDAGIVAERLLASLAEPIMVEECEVVLSASIGIAGYPLDGGDATTLIANADAAMYAAKSSERNTLRFYTPIMQADARQRLQLVSELRRALANHEFSLRYQPSMDLRSGRIVAVEALLRWQHPERGELPPGEFVTVAESLGLIRRIDEWVLRTVCAQISEWDRAGMPPIRVAVNVSARWLTHPAFVEGLGRALREHQVAPQRMVLEITEGAMLGLGDDTERTMRALHDLGIEVAIDDFGTGYSSMAYLKLPAVSWLKIDRSFVTGLPHGANDVAIVEAMLAMARSLGLSTIAEGIEHEAQHEFLLKAGCDEGQGYLYSYPLPPAALERMFNPRPTPVRLSLVPPKKQ
ncbi:putative bifunctional diguanylate cyclase/phosphodiesterase [Rhodanobacter aciditrophus]|uniref:putative bifunctional diguanylate cyclase/phosphodiesterase n=1 Tax=Rhodanobacter aciditrophus TaxID=1623218 RepID=UPI003CE6F795